MKQIFLKALKIFFILTLILLAVLLIFAVVLILDWPLWVGFFILLGLIGIVIAFILLRKIWLKSREKLFVQQIIEQDESYLRNLSDKERDNLKQLQDRWKEAIDTLKQSHLRKHGNPLYVLPWYLVIGESGSGKTTAIKSARLSSFAEANQISGISGTRNCDWWFFEQAIIIDTAGRFTIRIDETRDKEEWQKFINLLAKYRKKEPLNGLIITIAANKLLEVGTDTLEEDGRTVRRRINELIRVLGAKPPIYVMVTKCDLIQGMTQFCDHLPEKALNQAMGFINHDLSVNAIGFLDKSINTLVDRIRDFRLLLLHKSEAPEADPGLLLFPEELQNIKQGLESFIKEAFQESPYQETQLLRGIFFSSGRQEGSPYSHFLQALGLIEEKQVLAGTSKGLFLHDLFTRILPKDRHLFAPTQLAIEWKRLTKSLGLASWVTLIIALCGLLSFAFVKNMRALRGVSSKYPKLVGEILTDMRTLDDFKEGVLKMKERNRNWLIPRFGLHESKKVEKRLKEEYVGQFQKGFLTPLDEQMRERLAHFSRLTPKDTIGDYISHLVRRINLLNASLETQNLDDLQSKPWPNYEPLLLIDEKGILSEANTRFSQLYLYYLIWHIDSDKKKEEIQLLQKWLKYILTEKNEDLQWLVTWANEQKSLTPVNLDDFWEGSLKLQQDILVAPAFTTKGEELIDAFMKEIELSLPDPGPPIIEKQKLYFNKWYRDVYFEAWHTFGTNFAMGIEKLKNKGEWQQLASIMPTDQGPFFSVLDRIALELEPLSEEEPEEDTEHAWVDLIYEFLNIKEQAAQEINKDKGFLARTTQRGRRLIKRRTGMVDPIRLESDIKAAKAYLNYRKALEDLAKISTSRNASYQTASQVYSEDPTVSQAPPYIASQAILELKNNIQAGGRDQKMFWPLVNGPLDFLWTLVSNEAACYLQDTWDQTVMAEIQGISGSTAVYELLGDNGYAWGFVKGPAKPFINWSQRKGYYATEALGKSIPFYNDLFTFLTQGARVQHVRNQNYRVVIDGKPTNANYGARLQPDSTILELKCIEGVQRLENYNFPCREVFNWSPDACEDVILEIRIGNIKLTKSYKGYNAFPNFLKDFKGGKRQFFRDEFRAQSADLNRIGVKYIEVEYRFTGHKPVLDLLNVPSGVPKAIVKCWDH